MKNHFIIKLLFAALMLFSGVANAQSVISGKVVDDSGIPLPGVTVQEMNVVNGTITDIDGTYALEVQKSTEFLVFSYLGFKKQEVAINGLTTIDVVMSQDAALLDEVVVVGYGTQKRSDLTGAVTSLGSGVLENRPITNFEEALQGQVSGLSVSSTGGQPGAATK